MTALGLGAQADFSVPTTRAGGSSRATVVPAPIWLVMLMVPP
jgi:hypothetical protein